VKLGKIFTESEKVLEIGGNVKQEGKCIIASGGMNAPVPEPLSEFIAWVTGVLLGSHTLTHLFFVLCTGIPN